MTKILDKATKFNEWLGLKITAIVGTMWTAYIFAGIALISLPAAINTGSAIVIVSWVAQTFLQLVLLSIIMVGQGVHGDRQEQIIRETHDAARDDLEASKQQIKEIHTLATELHRLAQLPTENTLDIVVIEE